MPSVPADASGPHLASPLGALPAAGANSTADATIARATRMRSARIAVLRPGRPRPAGRLGAFLLWERDLAQADVVRRHLDALILSDELERLLEHERPLGDQPRELLRVRLAHVGELLLLRGVDVDVLGAGVLAHDHPFVHVLARPDEHGPSLLECEQRERGAHALSICDERAGRSRPELAVPRLVAFEHVVELPGAACLGQELGPEPDQAPGRDQV